MIKSIQITNFQSHQKTELSFAPGVNVIVGLSDTGKSAIFRALLWVLFNRPLGDGFRSHWAGKKPTEVCIKFSNGPVIRRIKGNTVNEYHINDTVLKAFGQDPPEEVVQTHRIDRTLNIQSQIDPFFLLQSSPGEVATYLNQVAQLADIDRVSKGLQLHSRNLRRNADMQSTLCDNIRAQLEQYIDLDQIGDELDALERLASEIEKLKSKQDRLEQTVNRIKQTQHRLNTGTAQLAHVTPQIELASQQQSETKQLRAEIVELRRIVSAIIERQCNIERLRLKTAKLERQWHIAMPEGAECPLCGHIIKGA